MLNMYQILQTCKPIGDLSSGHVLCFRLIHGMAGNRMSGVEMEEIGAFVLISNNFNSMFLNVLDQNSNSNFI